MGASYVVRLGKDDKSCFDEIYYNYNKQLFAYFYRRTHSRTICEDLVQETFTRLWKYRTHLDEQLTFEIQLFRIARTAMIDVARRNARMQSVSFVYEEHADQIQEVDTQAINKEKRTELLRLIETLPTTRKKILGLKLDGYSNREIAQLLTVTVKTVENNINTAYNELRKLANISPALLLFLFL